MPKFLIIISFLFLGFAPADSSLMAQSEIEENIFKAEVVEILEQTEKVSESGQAIIQQDLLIRGLAGQYKNQQFEIRGISEIESAKSLVVEPGDKVIVAEVIGPDGQPQYYLTDYVRSASLWWLFFIFALAVLLVGKLKGLRAMVVLALSFFIILKFIIPQILNGSSPLIISLIGSIGILFLAVFVTEGFNKKSLVSFTSIILSLGLVFILSLIFTQAAKLSGTATEEISFLMSFGQSAINFQGLLLAGIIIGALGVLDDVVISQVSLVKELLNTDAALTVAGVYKKAMNIGIDHISAIINTLFLAYAGAALPLLVLFSLDVEPFLSFEYIINNEMIATEIVRTLAGSLALVLSVPLATYLAAVVFTKSKKKSHAPSVPSS